MGMYVLVEFKQMELFRHSSWCANALQSIDWRLKASLIIIISLLIQVYAY